MAVINGTAGNDVLNGTGQADTISGFAGNDVLIGDAGPDSLIGGTGADTMIGGMGADTYVVDDAGDVVSEDTATNQGVDLVQTSVTYALPTFVENLTATGSANINLTGNTLANAITGNSGANVLDGGLDAAGGAGDTLTGGSGNDTYIVRNGDVTIAEDADDAVNGTTGGNDTVIVVASADRNAFTLTTGAVVENIIASDAASTLRLDLTGNATTQTIVGNAGVNTLADGGGSDTLIGLDGNDIYTVSSGLVTVVEGVNGGNDIINITGTGAASNAAGTVGARDYNFSNALVEQISALATGTGFLNITGSSISQSISGNAGSNVLIGNGGTDTLTGLGGDDTYVVDSLDDVVVEATNGGADRVIALGNYALARNDANGAAITSNVELLTASGTLLNTRTGQGDGTFSLNALSTATTLNNYLVGDAGTSQTIFGSAGNNILDGFRSNGNPADTASIAGNPADTLVGLGGSDTYRVYDQTDVVVEDADGGFDWIYTSANYSLRTNQTNAANATFTDEDGAIRSFGTAVPTGAPTGTVAGNYIAGQMQIEILSAANQQGTDVALQLEGNSFGQIIVGNFANNVISDGGVLAVQGTAALRAAAAGNSAGGQDQLAGLRGNDTYNVTAQSTTVNEDVGNGTDVVNVYYQATGGTFGLIAAAEVEFLNASNAGVGINLFGNGFNQVITGNTGNDNINGGGGQDTLVGGVGSDVYVIDSTNAQNVTIIENQADAGIDRVNTSVSFDLANINASYVDSAGTVVPAGAAATTTTPGFIDIEEIVGIGGGDISLTGNGGRQFIVGTTGNNVLNGDNDTLTGTVMTGTAVGDTMQGLTGNDTYRVYTQADVALEADGQGTDIVFAGFQTAVSGNTAGDSYSLYAGQSIEGLSAANQARTVGMTLIGNELAQSAGITGTAGNDTIWGLGGNDVLTGRGGSDIFGFAEVGAGNADTITDFTAGDFIGLQNTAPATGSTTFGGAFGSVGAALASDEFVVGTQALDANDYIIYNQSTGQIFYDADGNGTGSTAVLFAQITPGTALGFNDFTVLTGAAPTPPTFTGVVYETPASSL
jgi:Ca2+-binding RTX toxin-like protein